ncbi:MAG: CGNR zinc finger domain-containing protein [Solirubrobacteraceae bacterium]
MSSEPPLNLQLVIDFVNTRDLETGVDEIATPNELAGWLAARRLTPAGAPLPSLTEHADAVALREALRAVLRSHTDGGEAPGAAEQLDRAAQRGAVSMHFGADGAVTVAPRASDFAGTLGLLLVPVAQAAFSGSWERVKACGADDCRWAFYDQSRNRSGRWCDMAVCGNRTKVRAYRAKSA